MATNQSSELSLFDLVRVIFRRRRLAFGVFAGCLGVTLLAAWFWPRHYVSESKLFIRLGRDSTSLDPTTAVGRPNAVTSLPPTRESEINSITEFLSSRVLLDRVVDEVGPEAILSGTVNPGEEKPSTSNIVLTSAKSSSKAAKSSTSGSATTHTPVEADWMGMLSERDRAIVKLRKNLEIQPVKKSEIVRIAYESPSPRLSQEVVNSLVEVYMAEHFRMNRTFGAREFLERQTDEMRLKLANAEEGLHALKDLTGLTSVETQRSIMVTRAGRLEDELLTTEAMLKSTEAEVEALRATHGGLPKVTITATTDGIPNHGVDLMHNELYRLQLHEQELRSKYTDEHYYVKQARDRVAQAQKVYDQEKQSRQQVTSGSNELYDQASLSLLKIEPQLSALHAKVETLRKQLEQVCEQIKTLNANEVQIAQMNRDLKQHEINFQAYSQHLEQARIDEALEEGRISSISVVQPATFEPKASNPKLSLILSLGMLLGLVGAVAVPLVAESFEMADRHPRDVQPELDGVMAANQQLPPEQIAGNGPAL